MDLYININSVICINNCHSFFQVLLLLEQNYRIFSTLYPAQPFTKILAINTTSTFKLTYSWTPKLKSSCISLPSSWNISHKRLGPVLSKLKKKNDEERNRRQEEPRDSHL